MLKKSCLLIHILILPLLTLRAQAPEAWWKRNNLRVIQANLPDYKAATLNPWRDSYISFMVRELHGYQAVVMDR
jgi:hypothetical protein